MQRSPEAHTHSSARRTTAACVVDHDNLCNRTGIQHNRALLDIFRFADALRQRGVSEGTICRNWHFSAVADRMWHSLGFEVLAAQRNCDPDVILSMIHYVEQSYRDLILVAGDGDYVRAVDLIRRCDVRVEVWSRRRAISTRLAAAADRVCYVDRFLINRTSTNRSTME